MPLQCRYAPGVETSSGLALRRGDARRSGRRASARRQSGAALFRDRQDQRSAHAARRDGCARRRALAAHLLRGIRACCAGRRRISSSTLRPRPNGRPIGSTATEAGCASATEISAPRIEVQSSAGALHVASLAGAGSAVGLAARQPLAARPLGGDRGNERPQVLLGAGASARQAGFPSFRLLCARTSCSVARHEIRHRSPSRRTRSCARRSQGRRVALLAHPASVTADLTHSLDALAACGDIKLTAAFGPQHGLRGDKQDNMIEIAGLPRSGARHPGVQPVRRGAQADRCDDGHLRRRPRRSAGSGLPHLHLRHDAALRARSGGEARQSGLGAGSPQSRRAGRSKA